MTAPPPLPEGVGRPVRRHGWSKIERAQLQSDQAIARVQGMKLHAELDPPQAAPEGFPYPHRTCREWAGQPKPVPVDREPRWRPREMTDSERIEDAQRGSRLLKAAIGKVTR